MRSWVLLISWFLIIAGCGHIDDRINPDPCATDFDGNGFIARIADRHALSTWSVRPRNYRSKMAMDPDTVDCGTIHASIGFSGHQEVGSDSFALSIARLFYEDQKNAGVSTLDLELVSLLDGIGRVQAHYVLGRSQLRGAEVAPPRSRVDAVQCTVVSEHPVTISMGDVQRKGLALSAQVVQCATDMAAVAARIKSRYDARIQQEGISELTIDIRVVERTCSLCDELVYSYFFVRENNNL